MKTKPIRPKKTHGNCLVRATGAKRTVPKTLESFLIFHCKNLLECLELRHFHVYMMHDEKSADSMSIRVDYTYLLATITWGKNVLDVWKNKERNLIIRYLCHELCHIIIGENAHPFETFKPKTLEAHFDERVNEQVSRLAYRLYWRWLKEEKRSDQDLSFNP